MLPPRKICAPMLGRAVWLVCHLLAPLNNVVLVVSLVWRLIFSRAAVRRVDRLTFIMLTRLINWRPLILIGSGVCVRWCRKIRPFKLKLPFVRVMPFGRRIVPNVRIVLICLRILSRLMMKLSVTLLIVVVKFRFSVTVRLGPFGLCLRKFTMVKMLNCRRLLTMIRLVRCWSVRRGRLMNLLVSCGLSTILIILRMMCLSLTRCRVRWGRTGLNVKRCRS